MKKVLIVGGAGFIGTELTAHFVDIGWEVTVLDTFWFGNELEDIGCKICAKNVKETTEEDYRGYDTVIYLAGLSNDPMSEFMPRQCFIDNGAMPPFVASLCKKVGVPHFIYASTCSVYGWSPEGEKTPYDPVKVNYPYGLSKYIGEAGVMALVDDFFHVTAVRMGTVCGISKKMRFDLILNTIYKNIVSKGEFRLSNPSIHRPILDMLNLVNIYENEVRFPRTGIFNAVSFNASLGEIARSCIKWAQGNLGFTPKVNIDYVGDLRNYIAISSYEYTSNVESILDCIHALGITDFDDPKYNNNEMFKALIEKGEYK